jgi:ATP-dependent DNA helicase PIF1
MYSILDTLTLLLFFLVAAFLCCMLHAFTKLGASLRLFPAKGPQLPLPRAHLSRTRLSTVPRRPRQIDFVPRHYYGYLAARPHTTQNMLKQAVQEHNAGSAAAPPASSNPAFKQPSLANTLNRAGSTQRPGTRPVAFGANNIAKKNAAGVHRSPTQVAHGAKRTSSGLAKTWSSNEDMFEYPTLNVSEMEKENDFPAYRTPSRSNSGGLATALFDEDDFDSDIDLDVEDPATKGTVTYPKLPPVSPTATRDSGYSSRPQSVQPKIELDSSQPIPWSSSPAEHFKTPPKPQPPKSKRRTLPWSQQQSQHKQQLTPEPEEDVTANKKRKSAMDTTQRIYTPQAKEPSKPQYPWNTTASAIKLQQKTLREQYKAKVAESIDDTESVKRKKKNVIAKMFLSDEQKNVLDLVIAHKKSVFFTGSAGMC